MYVVIYHKMSRRANCPDGFAAAWVVWRRLQKDARRCLRNAENYDKQAIAEPENAHVCRQSAKALREMAAKLANPQLWGCTYEDKPPEIAPGSEVIIVDFSFPLTTLQQWAKLPRTTVKVIDHHVTSMNDLASFSNAIFDVKECGATLAWKHFFPNEPMPAFLEFVRDRDLWRKNADSPWWGFSLPETAYFHEAMGKMGRDFDLFDKLAEMDLGQLREFLLPKGKDLVDKKIAMAEQITKTRAKLKKFYDYEPVAVVRLENPAEERIHSDVGACMLHHFPEAKFAAIFSSQGKCSLRSLAVGNNFDVEAIAKRYGGGGHRNAAGFVPQVSGFSLNLATLKR
jgi:hypothetical protein